MHGRRHMRFVLSEMETQGMRGPDCKLVDVRQGSWYQAMSQQKLSVDSHEMYDIIGRDI